LYSSIFSTHNKIKLGPGEYYDKISFSQVKSRSLAATIDTRWKQNEIEEKHKLN